MKTSSNPQESTATRHPLINFMILVLFLALMAGVFAYIRFIAIPTANEKIESNLASPSSSQINPDNLASPSSSPINPDNLASPSSSQINPDNLASPSSSQINPDNSER